MTKVELYKFRPFVVIVHLIGFAQYVYAIYFYMSFIQVPSNLKLPKMLQEGLGKRTRFLTFWCLIIQALYFTISLINDFVGTNEVAPKHAPAIRRLKDYVLASLAFPVAMNVGFSFWTIYAIDRELVFPRALDAFFPGWLNHVMHTNIVVFIVLEMFISFRLYPKRRNGLTGLILFMGSYLVWLHIIKHFSGIWVYPILDVLELPQRLMFFVVILVFTFGLYYFGEFLNSKIWGKEIKLALRKTK